MTSLAISPQLFHTKLKTQHCSLVNPTLIHPLSHTSLRVSAPNTIHHSRLTVCLTDSLDFETPAYRFCYGKRL